MSDVPRVPLILMRVGGIMVAAGIALAYLAWALSYSRVSLAAIAIPIGAVLIGGVLVFVVGAVSGAGARQETRAHQETRARGLQPAGSSDPSCRR